MAITSSTDIANLALDLLSAGNVQDIETPTTATEELLERWYTQSRRKVLREHPWNFAAKRIVLAASATAPAFGYDTQYPVPADFIRVLTINESVYQADVPTQGKNYAVENGHILTSNVYSDDGALNLKYVCDYTTVSGMDPMFIDLLAHEIALCIAFKITEANSTIERLAKISERRGSIARAIDGQESPPRRIQRSVSRHVRRNNGSGVDSNRIIF